MRIELVGAINYNELASYMNKRVETVIDNNNNIIALLSKTIDHAVIINKINELEESLKEDESEYGEYALSCLAQIKILLENHDADIANQIDILINGLHDQNAYLKDLECDVIETIKRLEREKRTNLVASAGCLSRHPGTVFDIIEKFNARGFAKNLKTAKNILSFKHDSVSDHDYLVFAMNEVSAIVEQTLIEERFASFTIKSRREVDVSNSGFYVPTFRDKAGNIHPENAKLQSEYIKHMQELFSKCLYLQESNILPEDARFVAPYCFYSNFFMGIDAHTLKDLIIKLTKTKYAKIAELKALGEKLYEIAKVHTPYIIDEIDAIKANEKNSVRAMLDPFVQNKEYEIIDEPKLIDHSKNIDDTIIITAIMRTYEFPKEDAIALYEKIKQEDPDFKYKLMKTLAFLDDGIELAQVSFTFQIALSYAVLTHLTRHRTHPIAVPMFYPVGDLLKYKTPPAIEKSAKLSEIYDSIYADNKKMYDTFKNEYEVCDSDLVYFTLSGNMCNIVTTLDGKTLRHILEARECACSQWETRAMAHNIHAIVKNIPGTEAYASILGPTCETKHICNEGKRSCGKIKQLINNEGV